MLSTVKKVFSPISKLITAARSRRGGLPLLVLACIVFVIFILVSTRPVIKSTPRQERVWTVEAITAKHQDIQPPLKLYGIVAAGRKSELRALVAGNVIAVGENFKDGAQVSAGDLLVEIDAFEYEISLAEKKASLTEANAKHELLKRDLKRAKKLIKKNDASQQFLDNAQLSLDQQQAIVEQRSIGVKRAERDLEQTRLTAPYDGILAEISVQTGKRIGTNDKVAVVIDNKRLEARFSLSNAQYGRILEQDGTVIGRPIEFSWHVGNKVITYQAKIERVAAEIAFGTGGIDIHATISNPSAQTLLRPGAFIQISVPDRRYINVISIPEYSLYGEDTVFVIRDDRLVAQQVEIIGYDANNLLIRNKNNKQGIKDGDIILTTQIREGGNGIKVNIAKLTENTHKNPMFIADEIPVTNEDNAVSPQAPHNLNTVPTESSEAVHVDDSVLTTESSMTDTKLSKLDSVEVK